MKDEKPYCKDWIEDIVEKVYENYRNRSIVLWGKYSISDKIREKLKQTYGIEAAFYVDGNKEKIDNKQIFSSKCLAGKSKEYYVVVPLAFYPSLKEELIMGGYEKDTDYYYFSDCILQESPDYYEDLHGNKVVGRHQGLKFVFSGFNSVIVIGKDVHLQESTIYVHNNTEIVIMDESRLIQNTIHTGNNVKFILSNKVNLIQSKISVENDSDITVGENCIINELVISMKRKSELLVGKGTNINEADWILSEASNVAIGSKGKFAKGTLGAGKNARIKIGDNLAIMWTYQIVIEDYTSLTIGNHCIISYDVILRGNDGHSIFDLNTGKNINSTEEISRSRKIVIGDHVWIGMRSIILYNSKIGSGSIIGAASLVKGVIPNNCIAVGVPAKIKRDNIAWDREAGVEILQEEWDYRDI